jgi:hypothetical protein
MLLVSYAYFRAVEDVTLYRKYVIITKVDLEICVNLDEDTVRGANHPTNTADPVT